MTREAQRGRRRGRDARYERGEAPRGKRPTRGKEQKGGQGRTVNFRYGTPRKAGSSRRDKKASLQVAAPEDDSFLLSPSCPFISLRVPFGRERPGKLYEEKRRLSFPTKVSFKTRGTLRSKRKKAQYDPLLLSAPSLVNAAAATPLIGCSSCRNCRRSPTRNLARRKYSLMSSYPFTRFFFSSHVLFMFFRRSDQQRKKIIECLLNFQFRTCVLQNRNLAKLEENRLQ